MAPKKGKKATPKEAPDVAAELAAALSQNSQSKPQRQAEAQVPEIGDRVTITDSKIGTVFLVTQVGDNKVTLNIPGTNFNRYNVPFSDLSFVETVPRSHPKPAAPAFNTEEIRERVDNIRLKSMDDLSGELAILKKYLQSKQVPAKASEHIDAFCDQQERAWQSLSEKISKLLDE